MKKITSLIPPALLLFSLGALAALHAADTKSPQTNNSFQDVKTQHADIGVDDSVQAQKFVHTLHPDAQWFGQPQLGLFVHWGLSPVEIYGDLSWAMRRRVSAQRVTDPAERDRIIREKDFSMNGKPVTVTPNVYWKQAEKFNPQKWDPEMWIAAAKEAGFTYAVLVVRHHEGFALWPSAYGDFNTKNYMGGRDLVKPFVDACRKHGLKVGLYFSPQDWHFDRDYMNFLDGAGPKNPDFPWTFDADLKPRLSPPDPVKFAAHQKAYGEMIRGQIEELLTRYGKIDLLWFDGCPPDLRSCITFERIRELQPGIVLNNRLNGRGDFKTHEQKLTATAPTRVWAELEMSMTGSFWAYSNAPFTSMAVILRDFSRARSFDINMLINVGPDKNGELHPTALKNIGIIGAWMKTNGESVQGTHSLPSGEKASVPAVIKGTVRYLFISPEFKSDKSLGDKEMMPLTDVTVTLAGISQPSAVTLLADGSALSHTYDAGTRTLSVSVPAAKRTLLMDVLQVK